MDTTCVWEDVAKRTNGETVFGLWGDLGEKFDRFWTPFWEKQIAPFVETVLGENYFSLKNGGRIRFVKEGDADCGIFFLGEEKAITTLTHPCIVVLEDVEGKGREIQEKYGVPVAPLDGENFPLGKLLMEFSIERVDIQFPSWIKSLHRESDLVSSLIKKLKGVAPRLKKMRDANILEECFIEDESFIVKGIEGDMSGIITLILETKEGLFYDVLSRECKEDLSSNDKLMAYVVALSRSKGHYEKIEKAFESAKEYGYGIVLPSVEEMNLEEPKLVKKGSSYGVKFKGVSPSYHVIKVDVAGEVVPIVGAKEQGEEFVKESMERYETDQDALWTTNLFGKTLRELLDGELYKKGDFENEAKKKLRRALERVINEGKGGVICILL